MGKLAAPDTRNRSRDIKIGCNEKVVYEDAQKARKKAFKLYQSYGKRHQVYKCNHCTGYHTTTTRIKNAMTCPVWPRTEESTAKVHIFTQRRIDGPRGKETVASCIYCACILDSYLIMTPEQFASLSTAIAANRFQECFIAAMLETKLSRTICLNDAQLEVVRQLCPNQKPN